MITEKNSLPFYEPALVIRLEESELDYFTAAKLRDTLIPASTKKRVVIDLSNVTYMDSVSLGVLVQLYRERVNKRLSPFILVANKPGLRQVLTVTGFDTLLPVYDTLDEAIKTAKAEKPFGEP